MSSLGVAPAVHRLEVCGVVGAALGTGEDVIDGRPEWMIAGEGEVDVFAAPGADGGFGGEGGEAALPV